MERNLQCDPYFFSNLDPLLAGLLLGSALLLLLQLFLIPLSFPIPSPPRVKVSLTQRNSTSPSQRFFVLSASRVCVLEIIGFVVV
jgi:hypothetical protein